MRARLSVLHLQTQFLPSEIQPGTVCLPSMQQNIGGIVQLGLMKKWMAHFRSPFCNSMLEHVLMPAGMDC